MKREYFLDIHPPLGKLLLAAVGSFFGYDGSFSFSKTGLSYEDSNVPYVGLRSFPALCGALMVVVVYSLLIEMKFSVSVAVLAACMVAFGNDSNFLLPFLSCFRLDNGFTTSSRFISVDSQLLFFMITACFCWSKFRSRTNSPFTLGWWFWLSATGVCLGSAMGVKYIGFFVTAIIGLCTIYDLWDVSGVKKTPKHVKMIII